MSEIVGDYFILEFYTLGIELFGCVVSTLVCGHGDMHFTCVHECQ